MTIAIRFQKGKHYRTRNECIVRVVEIDTTVKDYPWVLCELVQNHDGSFPEIKSRITYDSEGKHALESHASDLMEEVQ